MIRILLTVLPVASSAPSLLNAAVECVEQWLHLPGSNLRQWTSLLSLVFSAVRDDRFSGKERKMKSSLW